MRGYHQKLLEFFCITVSQSWRTSKGALLLLLKVSSASFWQDWALLTCLVQLFWSTIEKSMTKWCRKFFTFHLKLMRGPLCCFWKFLEPRNFLSDRTERFLRSDFLLFASTYLCPASTAFVCFKILCRWKTIRGKSRKFVVIMELILLVKVKIYEVL